MFAGLTFAVASLDQLSKYWAVGALTRTFDGAAGWERLSRFLFFRHPASAEVVVVHPDFWHFRYVENPGAVWGFLSWAPAWFRVPFFLLLALVAMVFLVSYFRKTTPEQSLVRVGLGLVLGGAVGNFLDRVRLGYVIDFISWHYHHHFTWPTFNIADVGISVGVGLLLLDMVLHRAPADAPADTPAPS